MAVALLALFVALGGSAVAVSGRINGKVLKRNSVPGNRIKRDTLTGRQIREAKLGMVPRSALATAATHADSADKLGSLTAADFQRAGTLIPFDVRMKNTDPNQTLAQAGPFTLKADCHLNGVQNVSRVFITTSENDGAVVSRDMFDMQHRDSDFDTTEQFESTAYQESGTPPPPNGPFQSTGEAWSRGGVSLTWFLAQGNHLFSSNATEQSSCTYAGFAVVGP